jgi:peptidoglycan L-alanyl-D-glutamate endopeptidase CwlK
MVKNKPDWNYDFSKLAPIAARFGIAWGGNFKNLVDKPHFEITFGFKVSQLADITADRLGYTLI